MNELRENLKKIKELTESLGCEHIVDCFNKEVLNMFLDNSPIVSWIKDSDGKYIFANKSFLTRFNITEDISGKTDRDFFPSDVVETIRTNDRIVLERNEKVELREDVPTPDGIMHHWFVIKCPIVLQTESYVGGFAIDLTNYGVL